MLYYVFSGPLSLRAYVPEIKFNNKILIPENFCYYPPPHRIWIPENFCYPPPLNPFGHNSVCPPQWMLARTPMGGRIGHLVCKCNPTFPSWGSGCAVSPQRGPEQSPGSKRSIFGRCVHPYFRSDKRRSLVGTAQERQCCPLLCKTC